MRFVERAWVRRVILLFLIALVVGWAPAPFPKTARRAPQQTWAGVWDVDWSSSPVRLQLRADKSARFEYKGSTSGWNGSWRQTGPQQVFLKLDGIQEEYELTFDTAAPHEAQGKARHGRGNPWVIKFTRTPR